MWISNLGCKYMKSYKTKFSLKFIIQDIFISFVTRYIPSINNSAVFNDLMSLRCIDLGKNNINISINCLGLSNRE